MLTLKQLKVMAPDTIFDSGQAMDDGSGINMSNTGSLLRWVAVRGGIHDWAIYCDLLYKSIDEVRDMGEKIHDRETVKRLVPCDDEALAMYRD